MSDYKIEVHLYDVTSETEKQIFGEVLKAMGEEVDFYISVMNDSPVDQAERFEGALAETDKFVREFEEKKDVPGD